MDEAVRKAITSHDLESATRLAALEVHVQNIREATQRLEKGQTAQGAIINAMNESMRNQELMITTLTANLAHIQEEVKDLGPVKEQVTRWIGAVGLSVGSIFLVGIITTLLMWIINRYFPVPKQ